MTSPRTRSLLAALAVLATLAIRANARAHDPAKVLQLLSTKPDEVVVATNRGLVFGELGTRDFKLLCNERYGVSTNETLARFERLESGRLLVSSSDGLQRSDDEGCSWTKAAALADLSVPSMARDPSAPNAVYITTYTMSPPFVGTVRVSKDGGETFTTLYTGADEYLRTLQVVGTNPSRIYVAGMLLVGSGVKHFVAHSSDGGANWERSEIALEDQDEIDLTLFAVNPKDPNELLARASNAEPALGERLLLSSDAGRTFRSLGKIGRLAHASYRADGSEAYVAAFDGLFRVTGPSAERRLEPMPIAKTAVMSHVAEIDGALYAGGAYQGLDALADGVGIARGPDLSFERWFNFYEVDEEVQCEKPAPKACRQLWIDWQTENPNTTGKSDASAGDAGADDAGAVDGGSGGRDGGSIDSDDAGSLDAGTSGDGATEPDAGTAPGGDGRPKKSDDGCQLHHGGAWADGALPLFVAMLALRRRRRPSAEGAARETSTAPSGRPSQ